MLQVGVQTKGIAEERAPESGFKLAAAAGFECVDMNLDCFLDSTRVRQGNCGTFFGQDERELESFFMPWKRAARSCGLTFSQMHAPYPVSVWGRRETEAYMRETVIPKSLHIAGFLGIPYVVIHPAKLRYWADGEEEKRWNLEFFSSLIPLAKRYDLVILMENLYEAVGSRLVEGAGSDPHEAARQIDLLNGLAGEERFGFCLDTGHLNLTKRDAYEAIMALGGRIRALHLHDNDGYGDLHQLPYSFMDQDGAGRGVDWDGVLRGLGHTGYRGVLSFETAPCLRSFPDNMRLPVLRAVERIGRYFSERIAEEAGMRREEVRSREYETD